MQKNWFKSWFDSPYYHLLYNHRDYAEAERFINNLFQHLQLPLHSTILDLACGKGRHAQQIHNLGYNVVGVDLSPQSIKSANTKATEELSFQTGDMRDLPFSSEFNLVVNLFTSFGYFQQEGDNIKVIESISKSLKQEGILVLDYLNVAKIQHTLPTQEIVIRGEIDFDVSKKLENGFIVKTIQFEDDSEQYNFQEHVKMFLKADFESIFNANGFVIESIFGDYDLNSFDVNTSDRLILVAKKKE